MTAATELSFTFRIDPQPIQVGYAREQVRKVIPGWGLAEYEDLLKVIVTELVTNALSHGDGPIVIRFSYDGVDLWVEVQDSGDEKPVRQDPDEEDENGRGLQLIDGLIDIFGGVRGIAKHSRAGKTVFVALSLAQASLYLPAADAPCFVPRPGHACVCNQRSGISSRQFPAWTVSIPPMGGSPGRRAAAMRA